MPASRKPRIVVEVDPDVRRHIKLAAIAHDETVREYVLKAISRRLAEDNESRAWTALSQESFARDWDSDEDAIYDQV